MAKEFKQWDKAFSKDEITRCRTEWLLTKDNTLEEGWYEGALADMGYVVVGIEEARHVVYEAEGFRDWQLFRVSMKGLTTQQKVAMLYRRWIKLADCIEGYNETRRIWNYLGALKRGGQLVEDEFGQLIINK